MENKRRKHIGMIMLLCTFSLVVATETETEVETYIVQLNSPLDQTEDLESWYNTFLPTTTMDSDEFKPQMVYTYRNVLKGFAARLTAEQAREIETKDEVISARPDRMLSLHTTHSPNFLGLHQNLGFWNGSNYGKGIIIGVLDSGITPGHPSFDDAGVDPPPAKWTGKCEVAGYCNNKLIGAKNFVRDETNSPLDTHGHGTHTASIAAGNFVEGASVLGFNKGTAVGMAPLAHVAMYKVCGVKGCADSDTLAGMDEAIEEGVDVLSISIGGSSIPFHIDLTAIGAFAAIQKGIFVSFSAGNNGPIPASLSHEAPWVLTVGASTIDRKVSASVKLGNGVVLDGEALFKPKDFLHTLLPLVYPGMNGDLKALSCAPGSLKTIDVKGKVVICPRDRDRITGKQTKGKVVKDAGGAAMIFINTQIDGASTIAEAYVLPVAHVKHKDALTILKYMNSTPSPLATIIFHGTVIGDKSAPQVASFSSRGPNLESPGILKPDIIGPGVSILAAWRPLETKTTGTFNLDSGTSMACPHLSGIVALLKCTHPDWSLMTCRWGHAKK